MRKLVTIRDVSELLPIDGADFIELAVVDGWQCIVKKGEFKVGDRGLFFEIDSMIPVDDERFSFLENKAVDYNNKRMTRIRTMRMKGVLSQGLLLPTGLFEVDITRGMFRAMSELSNNEFVEFMQNNDVDIGNEFIHGVDLSWVLGVEKYEKPVDPRLKGGKPAGDFPHFIRKTDQERIQNCFGRLSRADQDTVFVPTLKMDGSSTTVAYVTDKKYFAEKLPIDDSQGQMYVCSRNLTLKETDNCRWWAGVRNSGILEAVKEHHLRTGRNLAVQGELVGPGIQGDHEGHDEYKVYLFSVFDIDQQRYLSIDEADDVLKSDEFGHVSTVKRFEDVKLADFASVQDYLKYAEQIESPFSKNPEGVVFHQRNSDGKEPVTFKAISNKYLLKYE